MPFWRRGPPVRLGGYLAEERESLAALCQEVSQSLVGWVRHEAAAARIPTDEAEAAAWGEAQGEALRSRFWEEALERARRREPKEFLWPYVAACFYWESGQIERARATFVDALRNRGSDPRVGYALAALYYGAYTHLSGLAAACQLARLVEPAEVAALFALPGAPPEPRPEDTAPWQRDPEAARHAYGQLGVSARDARKRALKLFEMLLSSQLHPADRLMVERHIALIKAQRG
jgi:tetratricopeptide (TPR) repeat protein